MNKINNYKKGQKLVRKVDNNIPLIVTIIKVFNNDMVLINKSITTKYGENYLNYNTKCHCDHLNLAYKPK